MAIVAKQAEHYLHRKVGTGDSIDFVRAVSSIPGTGTWKQGIQVTSVGLGVITPGTIIATMKDDHLASYAAGGNHAAVYLSHDSNGIRVLDQWQGQHVEERHIGFNDAADPKYNANAFHVVE